MRVTWGLALLLVWLSAVQAAERTPASGGAPRPADHSVNAPESPVAAPAEALLLEADSAKTGVHFSGATTWSKETDDHGQPVLVAEVRIAVRGVEAKIQIRKNDDATLPATHLVEVAFILAPEFAGGGIANLAGILTKADRLATGKPLIGAGARVVGNTFIFALSDSPEDGKSNIAQLKEARYLDFAVIYETGVRGVVTVEKGVAGTALFAEALAAWGGEIVNRPVRTVRVRPDGTIVSE